MLIGILWLVCSIVCFVIYHKCFHVVYFNLANGCFREIVVCVLLGGIFAAIIYYLLGFLLNILLIVLGVAAAIAILVIIIVLIVKLVKKFKGNK